MLLTVAATDGDSSDTADGQITYLLVSSPSEFEIKYVIQFEIILHSYSKSEVLFMVCGKISSHKVMFRKPLTKTTFLISTTAFVFTLMGK